MSNSSHQAPSPLPRDGIFATTRWSLVVAAAGHEPVGKRDALEELCSAYWIPLYAYVRRHGFQVSEAEDLTQGFFAMLLDRGDLSKADPVRGRFRSFLLTSLKHFLSNERERAQTLKRGGTHQILTFDFPSAEGRYSGEPSTDTTPEDLFEKQWALLLLERAKQSLRDEYAAAGKETLFNRLQGLLAGDRLEGSYADAARDLEMTEAAVKVAMHRLRQRFGERLRQEIAQTVASPDEIDAEIRELFEALRK